MDGCAFWVGTRSLPVETPRSNLQGLGGEKTVHSCHIYIFQTVWKAVNIWKTTKKYGLAQQAAQRFDEAGVFGLFNQTKFRREKRHEFFQGGIYIIVYHPSPHPLKVATNHHELSSQRAPPSSAAPSVVFLSSLAFLVDAFPSLFAPVHEPKVFLLEVFTQCYPTRKIVGWDQRIFLEFLSHKVGIGIEVDFYNLWDLWPWKKKRSFDPFGYQHDSKCPCWVLTQHETETTRHGFLPQGLNRAFSLSSFSASSFRFFNNSSEVIGWRVIFSDPWLTWTHGSSIHGCHEILPTI